VLVEAFHGRDVGQPEVPFYVTSIIDRLSLTINRAWRGKSWNSWTQGLPEEMACVYDSTL
jgi:hypothetical protein